MNGNVEFFLDQAVEWGILFLNCGVGELHPFIPFCQH